MAIIHMPFKEFVPVPYNNWRLAVGAISGVSFPVVNIAQVDMVDSRVQCDFSRMLQGLHRCAGKVPHAEIGMKC